MGSLNVKRGNIQIDYGSFKLYNGAATWTTSFESDSSLKFGYASNSRYVKLTSAGNILVTDTTGQYPRITIRTEAPAAGNGHPALEAIGYMNGFTGFPVVELQAARGTFTSPAAVQANDTLGGYNAWGHTGSGFRAGMRFNAHATDTWTSTTGGTHARLNFADGLTEYSCARFDATSTGSSIQIGDGTSNSRHAFLDLVGDTVYSDYGLRVWRYNTGQNAVSEVVHRGIGNFNFWAVEGATIQFATSNTVRGGITSGGNWFHGSTTDTLTRTLGVTGIAQVTDRIRIGSASTSNIDATLNIEGANGGSGRTTQISGGAASLNLMYGNNWFAWGVDNNVWKIVQGTGFSNSGFNMNISNEIGIGGVPVAGYKIYTYGNTWQRLDQNAATTHSIENQTNGAAAQSILIARALGGTTGVGCVGTGWAQAGGAGYEVLNGGSGYLNCSHPRLAIISDHASGVINILTGGALNSNIRARWSAAGNLALGYGNTTDATEKLQLKTGNVWLDGTIGTHGIIFPDGSKQLTAINTSPGFIQDVRRLVKSMNPISYWRLAESSGTVMIDEMGIANGTYSNISLANAGLLTRDPTTSALFTGTGSTYGSVPYTTQLTPAAVSVIGVVNFNVLQGNILSKTESGGYSLQMDPTLGAFFQVWANGAYRIVSYAPSNFTLGKTYVLVGTFDGRYVRLYVDGSLVATTDVGAVYPIAYSTNNWLLIGSEPTGTGSVDATATYQLKAYLSTVAVFGSALTQDNISALVSAVRGTITTISDFADVEVVSPTQGQVLSYNATTGTWINSGAQGVFNVTGYAASLQPISYKDGLTIITSPASDFPVPSSGLVIVEKNNNIVRQAQYPLDNTPPYSRFSVAGVGVDTFTFDTAAISTTSRYIGNYTCSLLVGSTTYTATGAPLATALAALATAIDTPETEIVATFNANLLTLTATNTTKVITTGNLIVKEYQALSGALSGVSAAALSATPPYSSSIIPASRLSVTGLSTQADSGVDIYPVNLTASTPWNLYINGARMQVAADTFRIYIRFLNANGVLLGYVDFDGETLGQYSSRAVVYNSASVAIGTFTANTGLYSGLATGTFVVTTAGVTFTRDAAAGYGLNGFSQVLDLSTCTQVTLQTRAYSSYNNASGIEYSFVAEERIVGAGVKTQTAAANQTWGSWAQPAGVTAIVGLSDVVITSPADNQSLVYDNATSKWINETVSYTTSFTNASLTAGVLTVTHSLGSKFCIVQVYDEADKVILPDEITGTSTSVTTIDLTSFGVITGTWNVRVMK